MCEGVGELIVTCGSLGIGGSVVIQALKKIVSSYKDSKYPYDNILQILLVLFTVLMT
jgi:hypothetical protein